MPSVRRFVSLRSTCNEATRNTLSALIIMNADIRVHSQNYINAVHGSFSAFNPINAKKTITVSINNVDSDKTSIEINIDYTSYVLYVVIMTVLYLILGLILLDQASSSLDYLSELEHNSFIALVENPHGS